MDGDGDEEDRGRDEDAGIWSRATHAPLGRSVLETLDPSHALGPGVDLRRLVGESDPAETSGAGASLRGGWYFNPLVARCASRLVALSTGVDANLGFRWVRAPRYRTVMRPGRPHAARSARAVPLALVLALALSTAALPAAAAPVGPAETDVRDLVRRIFRKDPPPPLAEGAGRRPILTLVPIVSSKPSTGFAAGAGGSLDWHAGDPATTYLSSALFAATFAAKQPVSLTARLRVFSADDGFFLRLWADLTSGGTPPYLA